MLATLEGHAPKSEILYDNDLSIWNTQGVLDQREVHTYTSSFEAKKSAKGAS